ncbi:YggT family protein [Rhodoluna sp.]|uniref:YggT family protein n=1 Tax=Rhodoluna sp. TaxID=1969481 RepID=UPI0025EF9EFE|nr:YggT family protein [Rhodoluna sp.]
MGLLALILWWALEVYFYLLIGRLLVDMVTSINPSFRPKGIILVLFEVILTLTDPPLKLVRRIIPPLRMGAIQLDFGWTLLVFAIFFLQSMVRFIA